MTDTLRSTWRRIAPKGLPWPANTPRGLSDEARVFFVDSGAAAAFATELRDDAPYGPRRFLFRIEEGEGFASIEGRRDGLVFVIVPLVDSELRSLPLDRFHEEMRHEPALASTLDGWMARLSASAELPPAPTDARPLTREVDATLAERESLKAIESEPAWVEPRGGRLIVANREPSHFEIRSGPRPLASPMWVTARSACRVRATATSSVLDAGEVANGLAWLHELVLDSVARITAERERRELARMDERARRHRSIEEAALDDLASVAHRPAPPGLFESPIRAVLAAVGDEIGVDFRRSRPSGFASPGSESLESILRAHDVRSRRVSLSGEWWKRDCGCLVAFRTAPDNRPVALLRGRFGRCEMFDPVDDRRVRVRRENAGIVGPVAVQLYRPLPPETTTLGRLMLFSLRGSRRDLGLVLVTGLLMTLLGMVTPATTGWIIDRAIPDADRMLLFELSLALAAAAFGSIFFALAQALVLMRIGVATEARTQAALWDRLLRLRPSFFRQYSSGDLQSRVSSVREIGSELNGAVVRGAFGGTLALLNVFLLYYYSAKLALVAIGLAVVTASITAVASYRIRRSARVLFEEEGRFSGFVLELIQGVGRLQVAGAEGRALARWMTRYARQLRIRLRIRRVEDRMSVFNQVMPTLGTLALYAFAAPLLLPGADSPRYGPMSLGTFLAFNTAFGTFMGAAASVSTTFVDLLDTITKGRRIRPILEAEPETDDRRADPGRLTGHVEMRDVTFRYRADGPLTLQDISLRAEPGEFVAIVGPSGSGKSTIVRLLLGFETPQSGSVLFDGQDLAALDVVAVRRQLGVVLQNGRVNQGTIFENIAGGLPVTRERAMEAADLAGLADDLHAMPMGMHTIVSEGGGNLSGGQRQRLLIARALVHRPRILILDEATSALDSKTQAIVSENLASLDVTRLVVAHRLSTVRRADRIYVVEGGKILESGSFEGVMAKGGSFARMMRRQLD